MTEDAAPVKDEYVETAVREIEETVPQFAGMDGPQLLGAMAGLVVAVGREVFERLATVERALSIVDTSSPTRAIPVSAVEVVAPNEGPLPSRALQVVPPPPPVEEPVSLPVDPKLEQIKALEKMLEALRSGQDVSMAPQASVVAYEVRHTDGSLEKHVQDSLRVHPSRDAAELAKSMIEATHPGWKDKLYVEEVTR